jgi:hypothetical protein
MSLYNAVFGSRDPSLITFCIGKTADDFGRYRDVWIENSDGRLILAVYTRCGGGNRDGYEHVFAMAYQTPGYVSSHDDDFDCTYCTFRFALSPEKQEEFVATVREADPEFTVDRIQGPVDTSDRWMKAIDAIKTMPLPKKEEA